jgi:hypothetical protein
MDNQEKKEILKMFLRHFAMMSGTVMGVFWIIRFTLFVLGLGNGILMGLFVMTTLAVPALLGTYMRRYRDMVADGELSFLDGLKLALLSCFYASLLVAAAHFIYFRWMDHGYVASVYADLIQTLKAVPGEAEAQLYEPLEETLTLWREMSPINITLQLMTNNILWSVVMALPLALVMKRNAVKQPENNE